MRTTVYLCTAAEGAGGGPANDSVHPRVLLDVLLGLKPAAELAGDAGD